MKAKIEIGFPWQHTHIHTLPLSTPLQQHVHKNSWRTESTNTYCASVTYMQSHVLKDLEE